MRKAASICIAILALTLSARAQGEPSCKLPVNLDQLAAKGVIHKNTASNNKSRLTRFVSTLK